MGFNAYREAYDIARRTGQRGMALFLTPLLAGFHLFRGELDAVEALSTDPILEGAPLDNVGQSLEQRSRAADLRGDLAKGRALFEEASVALENTEDIQVSVGHDVFDNSRSLMEGRFADAYEGALAVNKRSDRPVVYTIADGASAAFLVGNRDWVLEIANLYRAAGVMARQQTEVADAVSALLDDPSPAAVRRIEGLMTEMDDEIVALPAAFLAAALALHGPESERERLDIDFRARADKYGFQGIVDLYEGLLADRLLPSSIEIGGQRYSSTVPTHTIDDEDGRTAS
jgi:hypothetical protein